MCPFVLTLIGNQVNSAHPRGIAIAVLWVYCEKLGPSDFLGDPGGLSSWDGDLLHVGSDVPLTCYLFPCFTQELV